MTKELLKHFLLISPSPNPLIPFFGMGVEILNEGILELP
jgi:hypothetical protein